MLYSVVELCTIVTSFISSWATSCCGCNQSLNKIYHSMNTLVASFIRSQETKVLRMVTSNEGMCKCSQRKRVYGNYVIADCNP